MRFPSGRVIENPRSVALKAAEIISQRELAAAEHEMALEEAELVLPTTNYAISTVGYDFYYALKFDALKFVHSRENAGHSVYNREFRVKLQEEKVYPVIDRLKALVQADLKMVVYSESSHCKLYNDRFFAMIYERRNGHVMVSVYGEKELVDKIHDTLFDRDTERPILHWYYLDNGNRMVSHELEFNFKQNTLPVHYPFLNSGRYAGMDDFYEKYRASDASILILFGEPGTGKTSFIRNYIRKYKCHTTVTYDERLMEQDEFFINYIVEPNQQLLVIEDADLLLTSRESHGNKIMSKLLNMSEGLINLFNKKIIFTTNLGATRMNDIDSALIRPGRCFDVLNFRSLTTDEANAIAAEHGLTSLQPNPDGYTLSHVFNQAPYIQRSRIGF